MAIVLVYLHTFVTLSQSFQINTCNLKFITDNPFSGVSNRWTGMWNGMVEWKMEWNSECTQTLSQLQLTCVTGAAQSRLNHL